MEDIRCIRETLRYAHRFRKTTMLIKLGEQIIPVAEEAQTMQDIALLNGVGIQVVLTHDDLKLSVNNWHIANITKECAITDIQSINIALKLGSVPVVYCTDPKMPDGEDDMVAALAIQLNADKLIFLTHRDGIFYHKKIVREATVEELINMLQDENVITGRMRQKALASIKACSLGVNRVHIINGTKSGALLNEIFTCKGEGTMIYASREYHNIRHASITDTSDVVAMLKDNAIAGNIACPIIYADIARQINEFIVFEVDKDIHGCVLVKKYQDASILEVSYLVTSRAYEASEISLKMLSHIIEDAQKKTQHIFLVPEKNQIWLGIEPWFTNLGFVKCQTTACLWYNHIGNHARRQLWVKDL